MKKKIALGVFAVAIFLLTAFVLFKMKEQKSAMDAEKSEEIFSEMEIKAAQDLKLDQSVQERIFLQEDMDAAVNKRVPAGEEGELIFEKMQ